MDTLTTLLLGFWTWQTPLSFLAGVGCHHLYAKYWRDRKAPMFTKKTDGTYRFSSRFWVYTVVATVMIGFIGVRTQQTANLQQRQAQETTAFAVETQDCLNQLITVLKTRVSYNDDISELNAAEREALQRLFTDALSTDLSDPVAKQAILNRYFDTVSAIRVEREQRFQERNAEQYPDPTCGGEQPE